MVRWPIVSGFPTAAWIGRVLEERHDIHGQQGAERDQCGRGPRAEPADAAEGVAEDQGSDAADRHTEDQDTGGETSSGLHGAADEFLAAAVVVAVGLFERDRRVHPGFTEEVGDGKSERARDKSGQHAADEQGSDGYGVHEGFP